MENKSPDSTRQWLPSFWWALALLVVVSSALFDGSVYLYRKYVMCPSRTVGSVKAPKEVAADMKRLARLLESPLVDGIRTWEAFVKRNPSERLTVIEYPLSQKKRAVSVTLWGTEKSEEAVVIAIPVRGDEKFEGKENLVTASGVIDYLKTKRLKRNVRLVAYEETKTFPFLSDLKAIAGIIVLNPGSINNPEVDKHIPSFVHGLLAPASAPYVSLASPFRSRAFLNVVASVYQRFSHTCSECFREPPQMTYFSEMAESADLKPYPVVVFTRVATANHIVGASLNKTLGLAKVAEGLSLDPTPATKVSFLAKSK